mmetsp:Transcript_11959/g.35817  ORF Transcript_11959/g.35817 Transcript_11959/m.35817 type:complete len:103 (+) Transcript_11959:162-470(+)
MAQPEEPQEVIQPKPASSKVIILFKAVGDAPILKQPKVKVEEQDKFLKVLQFLKRQLAREQVFAYLKEAFCPSPDEKIQTLYEAYAVDAKLVVSYACTPAWG